MTGPGADPFIIQVNAFGIVRTGSALRTALQTSQGTSRRRVFFFE